MDQSVMDALQRWPDVPAVYGWLSLSARGNWRLHPLGDAQQGGPGQGITNPQILGFMGRNYGCEPDGRWFFQNGPQRVYVRIDAAPYLIHLRPETGELITHNGLTVQQVLAWFADDMGQLFAQTDLGGAKIDDRDLQSIADILRSGTDQSLLDALEALGNHEHNSCLLYDPKLHYKALQNPVSCKSIRHQEIAQQLKFVANPQNMVPSPQVS